MIDPNNVTKFDRTPRELEEFMLFCFLVAGKNADVAAKKTNEIIENMKNRDKFFEWLAGHRYLERYLRKFKVGKYAQNIKTIKQIAKLDLATCSLEDLIAVHGINYKTATFFLLHSRVHNKHVVLDTHILQYLRDKGYEDVPKASPQSAKQYYTWSDIASTEYDKEFPGSNYADIDLFLWKKVSGRISKDAKIKDHAPKRGAAPRALGDLFISLEAEREIQNWSNIVGPYLDDPAWEQEPIKIRGRMKYGSAVIDNKAVQIGVM